MNQNFKHVYSALYVCDLKVFPNVRKLLLILVTLSVTMTATENTFVILSRLKAYLSTTKGEFRLNGLAMLIIHRDIKISTDAVLGEILKSSRRIN